MPVRLMKLDALLILQKRVSFLETFLFFRKYFLFSCRGRISFLLLYPLCQGFFRIFGNIPISFFHPVKGNDLDVYKDSQYLLTGLNPSSALIPS